MSPRLLFNKVQCKPTLRPQNRNGQGAWYHCRDVQVWSESKSRHDEEATVGWYLLLLFLFFLLNCPGGFHNPIIARTCCQLVVFFSPKSRSDGSSPLTFCYGGHSQLSWLRVAIATCLDWVFSTCCLPSFIFFFWQRIFSHRFAMSLRSCNWLHVVGVLTKLH